jgi:hypothetical protein
MMTYTYQGGRDTTCTAGRGRMHRNAITGATRKSGGTLERVRRQVAERDNYTCRKCGKDCREAYLAYLAGPRRNVKPVLVAAHLVPFKMNGLFGLNARLAVVNGQRVVLVDEAQTVADLRACGFSQADIDATLNVATYRADYDPNNLEAWCRECNSAEADAIAHERGTEVLMPKEEILCRVARAYALNRARR